MDKGMARLRATDFYDPEGREVEIPLDPLLTPQQNAAKYYKGTTRPRPPSRCSPSRWRRAGGSWTT